MSERPKPEQDHPLIITADYIRAMRENPIAELILDNARRTMYDRVHLDPSRNQLEWCKDAAPETVAMRLKQTHNSLAFLTPARLVVFAGIAATIPDWQSGKVLVTPTREYQYVRDVDDPIDDELIMLERGKPFPRLFAAKPDTKHIKDAHNILGIIKDERNAEEPAYNDTFGVFDKSAEYTYRISDSLAQVTFDFRQFGLGEMNWDELTYYRSAVFATISHIPGS